jgi:hypothetical protein
MILCEAANDYQRRVVCQRTGTGEILDCGQDRKEHRISTAGLCAPQV